MAGSGTGGHPDPIKDAVLLTVHPNLLERKYISTGAAFDPEFVATGAPEDGALAGKRLPQGFFVDVAHHDDRPGFHVLSHGRDDCEVRFCDGLQFMPIEAELSALFAFLVHHGDDGGARAVGKSQKSGLRLRA